MVKSTRRGQGTFEYVLLLGGALLVVVVAVIVLQSNFQQSATGLSDLELKQCRAAAVVDSQCSDASGSFQPGNLFTALSVPKETRCDCADFNPDAFFVPVGGSGTLLGGPGLLFSPVEASASGLSFASPASQPAYSLSILLPPGSYSFFSVANGASVSVNPVAVSKISDERFAYSFSDLPTGNLKVLPGNDAGADAEEVALASKEEAPSAAYLASSASVVLERSLDGRSSFSVFSLPDGTRYAVFSFVPPSDYAGGLSVLLPAAFLDAATAFPRAGLAEDVPSASGVTRMKFDGASLKSGASFDVVVRLPSSSIVDDGSVGAAAQAVQASHSPVREDFGLWVRPEGALGCAIDFAGFQFFCPPTPSGTPPSPELSCVPQAQGCGILPGSLGCCGGLSCQLDGFSTACKPDGSPSPSPSPEPSPSPSPTDEAGLTVTDKIVISDWQWIYPWATATPTPSPVPTPTPPLVRSG